MFFCFKRFLNLCILDLIFLIVGCIDENGICEWENVWSICFLGVEIGWWNVINCDFNSVRI